jgi:sodium transport system permease protein
VSVAFLRQMFVVMRKELRDSSRDRRAMAALIFSVLAGPAVIAFMVDRIADRERQVEQVQVPIVGIERAPALVDWLRGQSGVTIVPGPGQPERAVRDGDQDVVLVISSDFPDRFRGVKAAGVDIVFDGSRQTSRPAVNRVRELLARYSAEIGALRLVVRGISPEVAAPLRLRSLDVSTSQERAAAILNFLGIFMLASALLGGMQLATDSTAGERERQSLEPLLVNPVPRGALAAGKWLAASTASVIAVTLTMGVSVLLLKLVLAPDIGVRLSLGPPQLVAMLVAALSICPLSAALQATVGIYSRSFKEAQSYMGVITTVPIMAIALVGALYPVNTKMWMYAVPMLAQYTLVKEVIGGTPPGPPAYLLASTVSLGIAAALLALTTRLLRSERVVFGR